MPGSCQAHDYFAKGTTTMPDVCRIFAGVSGSPGSVYALRQAADLARRNDAILIPLHTWAPPEGDPHERRHPCQELRQLWEEDAWQRLWEALDTAFGGLPAGVRAQPVVLRGKPGNHLVPDDRGSCKGPPPDCRRIVICLRYGIKGRSGRRAASTGQSAW
jgi:hypothetical protein